MLPLNKTPAWQNLLTHHQQLATKTLTQLFAEDSQRFSHFSLQAAGLLLDYSKNCITSETLALLKQLAQTQHLATHIENLLTGGLVNTTENRPALHTALRNTQTPVYVDGKNITADIALALQQMARFCEQVHSKQLLGFTGAPFEYIVNIGIGGSDLGPRAVVHALTPYCKPLKTFFVSNMDGAHLAQVLQQLQPERTLFIISSKSFTTLETLKNAELAKRWLNQALGNNNAFVKHMIAVTAQSEKALAFGLPEEKIFPIWDWVGGRFSLWSAIGLPIALSIGMDKFEELLAGAAQMDQHFRSADFSQNMPVLLALLGIWYRNFFGTQTHAIIPYAHHLKLIPQHLQQTIMESTGKSVNLQSETIAYNTGPIIWGTDGNNGQHAYYQLLHQGTAFVPIDFILARQSHYDNAEQQLLLYANCLSQAQALMQGRNLTQAQEQLLAQGLNPTHALKLAPHLVMPGNHPSNIILMDKITPHSLGALLALYEHKTYVQSCLWNINCFDQWGVEVGKQIASNIAKTLAQDNETTYDSSTDGLIEIFKQGLTATSVQEQQTRTKEFS